jgi:hypothetical protein
MANYDELPVYKASYDLLLEVFSFAKEFKREYKHTIGEDLKKETVKLIILFYRINSGESKIKFLKVARIRVETIRLLVRLTKDLHLINVKKFVALNKRIENVSRQLTGWQRSVKK